MEFLANVARVSERFPEVPPVVATHKGFALPAFDQRCSTPRDVGYAAKHDRGVRFLVYHQIPGPRTRRAVLKSRTEHPWSP